MSHEFGRMGKVAIIDPVGAKAGMDYYDNALAAALAHNGRIVFVFSNYVSNLSGCRVFDFFDHHSNGTKLNKLLRLLWGVIKSFFCARSLGARSFVVHLFATDFQTLLVVALGKLFGSQLIVIAHDISSFANSDRRIVQSLIYNWLADDVVVHNEFSRESIQSKLNDRRKHRLHVIKQGGYLDLTPEISDKNIAREKLGLDKKKKYLLFFGQIKSVKGLDVLLSALAICDKDVNLIIAGRPWKDDYSRYSKIIEDNGLQSRVIEKIGFVEDDIRNLLFVAADALALPYRKIYQSAVLLMAMSYRLPIIASDLPANREVIRHQLNGLLFASENPVSLAENINLMFSNDVVRNQLADRAYETIMTEYSWNDIGREYVEKILVQESPALKILR